jgi:hypothetical protein
MKDDHEPTRTAITKPLFDLPLKFTSPKSKRTNHAKLARNALVVDDQ